MWMLDWQTPDEPTWIEYQDREVLVNPSEHLGRRVFVSGRYEPEDGEMIETYLDEGDVAMDVAANMGIFTVEMRNAVGSTGTVYAFGPTQKNLDLMSETIEHNGF